MSIVTWLFEDKGNDDQYKWPSFKSGLSGAP